MIDLHHVVGDMPLDVATARRLAGFIDRAGVEITSPAKQHTAGWVWEGRLVRPDVSHDHEPIKVLSVKSPAPLEIVRHVVCLTMRGSIDHVMQLGRWSTAIYPTSTPEEMKEAMRDEVASGWWACPFRGSTRCICMHP